MSETPRIMKVCFDELSIISKGGESTNMQKDMTKTKAEPPQFSVMEPLTETIAETWVWIGNFGLFLLVIMKRQKLLILHPRDKDFAVINISPLSTQRTELFVCYKATVCS
jgi:hypothetical protein